MTRNQAANAFIFFFLFFLAAFGIAIANMFAQTLMLHNIAAVTAMATVSGMAVSGCFIISPGIEKR